MEDQEAYNPPVPPGSTGCERCAFWQPFGSLWVPFCSPLAYFKCSFAILWLPCNHPPAPNLNHHQTLHQAALSAHQTPISITTSKNKRNQRSKHPIEHPKSQTRHHSATSKTTQTTTYPPNKQQTQNQNTTYTHHNRRRHVDALRLSRWIVSSNLLAFGSYFESSFWTCSVTEVVLKLANTQPHQRRSCY